MPTHAFVDETKVDGFALAVTKVDASAVGQVRQAMRSLLLPRQSHLHFRDEQDHRRQLILETIVRLPISIRIYATEHKASSDGRRACLAALASDLEGQDVERLVIEVDDAARLADIATLTPATRDLRSRSAFAFHHMTSREEPALWISDAAAWCYAKGGRWSRRLVAVGIEIVKV